MGISFGTGFQVIVLLYYIFCKEDYMFSNPTLSTVSETSPMHEGEGMGNIVSFPLGGDDDDDNGSNI